MIYAEGESMASTIHDGSVVLIDLGRTEPLNGKIFAIRVDDEVRIKRLFRPVTGGWRLSSDNPDKTLYPDDAIDEMSQVAIIGQCMWQGGGL